MKVEVTKEQSLIKNQRNSSLDFLKLFCSFLVIVFHAKPIYSQWTQPISCSAVPCFFMISGYLLYSDKLSERSLRSAKKTSIILFWSTLFYLPLLAYGIYTNSEEIKTLTEYIVDFLCFNENPASSHLWYLAAYVYDLLIVRYFYNRNLLVILFLAMPILWTVDMLGGFGGVKTIYLRNFLVTGIPCFTMGMLVRKCKMEKKVNSITMLLLIVLLSIGSVVESSYYESTHQNVSISLIALPLLLLFLNVRETLFDDIMRKFEKNDSLYVYIFHPVIMILLAQMDKLLPEWWDVFYSYVSPFLIFTITYICILTYRKIKYKFISRFDF